MENHGAEKILRDVRLRPAAKEDEPFLLNLFASTRSEELAQINLNESQKQAFIAMQFNAQSRQYDLSFPNAQHSIVLLNDSPIGRLLIDKGQREFRLVDVSLLAKHRNTGIGTRLIQNLIDEAATEGKPIRLYVFASSAAVRLYERLGFFRIGGDAVYLEMMWSPHVSSTS